MGIERGYYGGLKYHDASCTLNHRRETGVIYLGSLLTKEKGRGKGYATAILKEAVSISNSVRVPVVLNACPYDDRPLSLASLIRFYKSFGFKPVKFNRGYRDLCKKPKSCRMVYNPVETRKLPR